jgi:hypothetical protein
VSCWILDLQIKDELAQMLLQHLLAVPGLEPSPGLKTDPKAQVSSMAQASMIWMCIQQPAVLQAELKLTDL